VLNMVKEEYYIGIKNWDNLTPSERLDALFDYLNYISKNIGKKATEIRERFVRERKTTIYRVERLERILWFSGLLRSRYVAKPVRGWYFEITDLGRVALARRYLVEEDFRLAPDWVRKSITRKPIVVIPLEYEYIGTDTDTGYPIYYDKREEEYVLIHPERKEEVRRTSALDIIETDSVETEKGHETPFVAEITASNTVSRMGREEIYAREREIQKTMKEWFEEAFANIPKDKIPDPDVLKVGVEYRLSEKRASDYVELIAEKVDPDPRAGYVFREKRRLRR